VELKEHTRLISSIKMIEETGFVEAAESGLRQRETKGIEGC